MMNHLRQSVHRQIHLDWKCERYKFVVIIITHASCIAASVG